MLDDIQPTVGYLLRLMINLPRHEIRFYGVILLGRQYRQISLTPALSCLQGASDGAERQMLYAAFYAILRLQNRIAADLQHHLSNPQTHPIPSDSVLFPAISKLAKRDGSGDFEFTITGHRQPQMEYRLLYIALASDNSTRVLVKFSQTYCRELHEYCSQRGHAPKLLGFERLPGGWYGIAMEYDPKMTFIQTKDDCVLKPTVERLMRGFHEEGWVHGDLRHCNILASEDRKRVWVVDFDWGGKDGEVSYPTPRLNPMLADGRNCTHWKIRKQDDERVLEATFKELEKM
ncbi:protein kinase subdomain-containing protein PKL/ccin9 [Coprinopsis cinerea AmutBmut pab1-1]|nr:protein kinase subdomain-containing protein PKL/ccin9 [Coprinopsis cinerea AmutBmut pab1-1]